MQLIRKATSCFLSTAVKPPRHRFELRTPFDVFRIDENFIQAPGSVVKDDSVTNLVLRSTVFHSTVELLSLYKMIATIRRMELASDALYKAKFIRGFCHLAIGQEAIPAGIEMAITQTDAVITAYRCHGAAFARGASLHAIFAELLGKKTGISCGKGGSMHMYLKNFYGGNGIVGAQVPVGAGIAFAQKYKKEQNVTLALYGDGAANQGQVFEAYNMAKLWSLPCIFVCENNMYGMGTSAARSSASVDYFTRAGFIPGIRVDAQDVLSVIEATRFARSWALDGRGPLVLEMKTYRYQGHSMSDPGTTYRNRDEVQRMRDDHDPLTLLRSRLLDANLTTDEELKKIEKTIRQQVEEAAQQAKNDSDPDISVLFDDIYLPGSDPIPQSRGVLL